MIFKGLVEGGQDRMVGKGVLKKRIHLKNVDSLFHFPHHVTHLCINNHFPVFYKGWKKYGNLVVTVHSSVSLCVL